GEVHFHSAKLVGVDLLTSRADDDSRLRSLHDWLGREPERPELLRFIDNGEAAGEKLASISVAGVFAGIGVQGDARHQVFAVLIAAWVILELEGAAGRQPTRARLPAPSLKLRLQFVETHVGQPFAFSVFEIFAGE